MLDIVCCETYCGRLRWNYRYQIKNPDTEKRATRRTAAADVLYKDMPGMVIVSRAVWDKAAAIRAGRMIGRGKRAEGRIIPRNAWLFAGLFKCPQCGSDMRRQRGDAKVAYIMCSGTLNRGDCDHERSYNVNRLQRLVLDNLRPALLDAPALQAAAKEYREELIRQRKSRAVEGPRLRRELAAVTGQVERLIDMVQFGKASAPSVAPRLQVLEDQRARLAERVAMLDGDSNVIEIHPKAVDRYCSMVVHLSDELVGKPADPAIQGALGQLIERIVVTRTEHYAPYQVEVFTKMENLLGAGSAKSLKERGKSDGVTMMMARHHLRYPTCQRPCRLAFSPNPPPRTRSLARPMPPARRPTAIVAPGAQPANSPPRGAVPGRGRPFASLPSRPADRAH